MSTSGTYKNFIIQYKYLEIKLNKGNKYNNLLIIQYKYNFIMKKKKKDA